MRIAASAVLGWPGGHGTFMISDPLQVDVWIMRADGANGESRSGKEKRAAGALRDRHGVDYFLSALGAALADLLVVVVLG